MNKNPLGFSLTCIHAANDVPPLLYLACPYSHPDRMTRAHRALLASDMAARLIGFGYAVFSPISHGHAVCEADSSGSVGTDAKFWAFLNDGILSACDAVVVMDIPGMWESIGVRNEVTMATDGWDIPVNLVRLNGNSLEVEPGVDPMLFSDSEGRL